MPQYKPYQIVAGPTENVEIMSYPHDGYVFARRVIGDPTSAEYYSVAELGVVLAESEAALQEFYYLRADHVRHIRELVTRHGVIDELRNEILEALQPQVICACGVPTRDFSRACCLAHVHMRSFT